MFSKRAGILFFAILLLCGLVGHGLPTQLQTTWNPLSVSAAHASIDGDPDEYSGNPETPPDDSEDDIDPPDSGDTDSDSSRSTDSETIWEKIARVFANLFGDE